MLAGRASEVQEDPSDHACNLRLSLPWDSLKSEKRTNLKIHTDRNTEELQIG